MLLIILSLLVVAQPCTADDFASWRMAGLSRSQAREEYESANDALARGETEIGMGTRDLGDRLMDDADAYWAQIPTGCQNFLIDRGEPAE